MGAAQPELQIQYLFSLNFLYKFFSYICFEDFPNFLLIQQQHSCRLNSQSWNRRLLSSTASWEFLKYLT